MVIDIKKLSKVYKTGKNSLTALNNIEFTSNKGEVLGILGPNGAGKTTLLKIITGIIEPSNSNAIINVLGQTTLNLIKKKIGFLPENPKFFKNITAFELLKFTMKIGEQKVNKQKIDELLKYVSLYEQKNKKIREFSKGMIQRIGFAQAVINSPELLILDEPFSGIDPIGRKRFTKIIKDYHNENKTVIFSTHNLKDIEALCTKIIILRKGEIVLEQKMATLNEGVEYNILIETKDKKQKRYTAINKKELWGLLDQHRVLDSKIISINRDISRKIEGYYHE